MSPHDVRFRSGPPCAKLVKGSHVGTMAGNKWSSGGPQNPKPERMLEFNHDSMNELVLQKTR